MSAPQFPTSFNMGGNLSNVEKLLDPTLPKGAEFHDYINIRRMLLGKETYLGFLERADLLALDFWVFAIQENLNHGQIELALDMQVQYSNNLRTTPSVEGNFLKRITSQEFKYTQDQKVTEIHQAPKKRKGIIFNRG